MKWAAFWDGAYSSPQQGWRYGQLLFSTFLCYSNNSKRTTARSVSFAIIPRPTWVLGPAVMLSAVCMVELTLCRLVLVSQQHLIPYTYQCTWLGIYCSLSQLSGMGFFFFLPSCYNVPFPVFLSAVWPVYAFTCKNVYAFFCESIYAFICKNVYAFFCENVYAFIVKTCMHLLWERVCIYL